jgi:hypothetical protein
MFEKPQLKVSRRLQPLTKNDPRCINSNMKQQGNSFPTKPNNSTIKDSNNREREEISTNEFLKSNDNNDE